MDRLIRDPVLLPWILEFFTHQDEGFNLQIELIADIVLALQLEQFRLFRLAERRENGLVKDEQAVDVIGVWLAGRKAATNPHDLDEAWGKCVEQLDHLGKISEDFLTHGGSAELGIVHEDLFKFSQVASVSTERKVPVGSERRDHAAQSTSGV